MQRFGIRSISTAALDSTAHRLMNSVTPVPDSDNPTASVVDSSESQLPKVRWSIFDLFENDLVPGRPEPWIIRACSRFGEISSTLIFVTCLWSVWYPSLLIAFWEVLHEDLFWGLDRWRFQIIWSLDIINDIVFIVLLLARPLTSGIDPLQGIEMCAPKRILVREMQSSFFWADALSCAPWTEMAVAGIGPIWIGAFKMLRAHNLVSQPSISIVFQKDARLIARLLSLVMLGGHVFSCIYFSIGWYSKNFKRHPYFQLGDAYGFIEYYLYALRASVYLVVGADVEGYSEVENTFIFFITPIGVMVNALVFSQIIVVISRRTTLKTQEVEDDNNTRQAMQTLGIPSSLQMRIFAHYTYERVHRGHGTVEQLLGGLSDQLNFELHLARHYRLVTAVPFFKSSHPYVLREIVLVLTDVIFLPGDWICRLGDEGKEMYFLHKGACSVLTEDMLTMLRQVIEGDYFGEISLLTGMQRTAFVRADTFCMVAELAKDKFDQIMRRFPQQLGVIVSGFSEEQKALLLQIRRRLHQPHQPKELMMPQRLSNLPLLSDSGGARKQSIVSTPSNGHKPIPSGHTADGYKPSPGPAGRTEDGHKLSPAGDIVQRMSSNASKASNARPEPAPMMLRAPSFGIQRSINASGSDRSPNQGAENHAPLASVGSSLMKGVASLRRQVTKKLGHSSSKFFGESENSKSTQDDDDGAEDDEHGGDRVMPVLSDAPPPVTAQTSQRRPSVLGAIAAMAVGKTWQRRTSVQVQQNPTPAPPPLSAAKEGPQRRRTLQNVNQVSTEVDRAASPVEEGDENSSEDAVVVGQWEGQNKEEVEGQGAQEVSAHADGIREADKQLAGVSKTVEEAHHDVYTKCQLLEQTWLTKRAEIRDERADMGVTLQALAEQIAQCTSMLMRIASDDTQDDVALKAIDIAERDLDKQAIR